MKSMFLERILCLFNRKKVHGKRIFMRRLCRTTGFRGFGLISQISRDSSQKFPIPRTFVMDKRIQLGILDQPVSGFGQVCRSTKRLQQIAEWIDWQPLYKFVLRIDKTGTKSGQPRKRV